jgi:hypothetical protein
MWITYFYYFASDIKHKCKILFVTNDDHLSGLEFLTYALKSIVILANLIISDIISPPAKMLMFELYSPLLMMFTRATTDNVNQP